MKKCLSCIVTLALHFLSRETLLLCLHTLGSGKRLLAVISCPTARPSPFYHTTQRPRPLAELDSATTSTRAPRRSEDAPFQFPHDHLNEFRVFVLKILDTLYICTLQMFHCTQNEFVLTYYSYAPPFFFTASTWDQQHDQNRQATKHTMPCTITGCRRGRGKRLPGQEASIGRSVSVAETTAERAQRSRHENEPGPGVAPTPLPVNKPNLHATTTHLLFVDTKSGNLRISRRNGWC